MYPLLITEALSAGAFALGLLVLYGAVWEFRKRRMMRDTPTSKVRSLAIGNVEIKGVAEKHEEVFESPFTGKECVMYVYSVDVYSEGGRNSSGGWSTVEAGVKAAPFLLNDGTGKVLVDPEGAEKELPVENSYEYNGEEEMESIREFMSKRHDLFEESVERGISGMAEFATDTDLRMGDTEVVGTNRKRRYQESYLPVESEEVYVFGRAMRRGDLATPENAENLVISRTEDTPLFKISTSSEKENIEGARNRVISGAAFGFLFTVGGFGATLYTAGLYLGGALLALAAYGAYRFNEKFTMMRNPDRTS